MEGLSCWVKLMLVCEYPVVSSDRSSGVVLGVLAQLEREGEQIAGDVPTLGQVRNRHQLGVQLHQPRQNFGGYGELDNLVNCRRVKVRELSYTVTQLKVAASGFATCR